ncbi:MAG: Na/Pi symporter [Bacteroidales bacterium]|nr:Na/Pi symporter [Lachnoclostridium sp.]MCM1385012.1 Na/Pi symporter [Lachnoclostridium sp.]MCM1465900.1 Na/Pi symporter [Bacteroidales bacterium]
MRGKMDFFDFLTAVGGLALFLYGMNLMGEGLQGFQGGKLEHILKKSASDPLKALLVGAGVTALMQSSSAVTVLTVGFTGSGIMTLEQATGVIMGANVGTTVTAWMLGFAGIDSSSFFVRMLKPASFAPVLAIVGVVMQMGASRDRQKRISTVLVGFALLMFGMDTMSGAVKPLMNQKYFMDMLTGLSLHPISGMLAGTVFTAVIQSSSASIGILQVLCMTGKISYGAAIPVIMGQNIGTCATALLSGIGASRNAKRVTLIHLYFNVIGTAFLMTAFLVISRLCPPHLLQNAATPFGIAAIHSLFNITSVILLLPCSGLLVKLAYLTVPQKTRGLFPVPPSLR